MVCVECGGMSRVECGVRSVERKVLSVELGV